MVSIFPVSNFTSLSESQFETLHRDLATQSSMERALAYFSSSTPPLAPEDLIAQDEFSYDLLVPYPGNLYLSYDTN